MANARLQHVWNDLDKQERALKLEQKHLSEIWLKVCEKHKDNEAARAELDAAKAEGGVRFVDPMTPVRLNVGGQRFETTAGVLCRDEFSVLAGLCRGEGSRLDPRLPQDADEGGRYFFIDRDWWLFRHVLQFLRTGSLPEDPLLVEELYHEATFYRLSLLRKAVETQSQAYHTSQRAAAARPHAEHPSDHGLFPDAAGYGPIQARGGGSGRGCGCGGTCGECGGGGSFGVPRTHRATLGSSHAAGMRQERQLPDPFGFSGTMASRTTR